MREHGRAVYLPRASPLLAPGAAYLLKHRTEQAGMKDFGAAPRALRAAFIRSSSPRLAVSAFNKHQPPPNAPACRAT